MNLHYWLNRLRGKATCLLANDARLLPRARILNASGLNAKINIGPHCRIEGELFVFGHGGKIDIGEWCYVGPETRVWSAQHIKIGNRVLISHGVNIFDSLTHPVNPGLRHAQFRQITQHGHPSVIDLGESPVIIEDDVWIGACAVVLRGVHIGARSIIGAGTVVTQNVPANTVMLGNPARVVRSLTEEELS